MHIPYRFTLLLFAVVILLSAWIFNNTLVSGDALNMFSPYPILSANGGTTIAKSYLGFVSEWNSGQNGRLSQSILVGIVFVLSKFFINSPDAFPSWFFKGISLFFIMTSTLLVYKKANNAFTVLSIMLIWGYNRITVNFPLWFDISSLQYFLPLFLFLLIPEKKQLNHSWRKTLVWGLIVLFIANSTEHFFILTVSYFGIQMLLEHGSDRKYYFNLCLFALFAGVLFYLSPGQQARAKAVGFHVNNFGLPRLIEWYQTTTVTGYQGLVEFVVSRLPISVINIAHLVFVLCAVFLIFSKNKKISVKAKNYAKKSLGFLMSYSACLLTLFVSPYMPPWSITIPTAILALGLSFLVIAIIEVAQTIPKLKYLNSFIVSGLSVLLLVTIYRETPVLKNNALEVLEFSRIRKAIYKKVLNDVGSSQHSHVFYLDHFPLNSYGWSVEPPWCFSAYFRWVKKTNIQVVIPGEEYSYINIPQSIIRRIDYKELSFID
ncbi:MAG: hypothetical protein KA715_05320 [Xanthomonadaceae bacterium]|nr:hypothetical protein [Xanthomonadaceae bacterium]